MSYSAIVRDTLIFLNDYQGILTILGWFAVFWLAIQASKIQLRNSARLEIYKELQELKYNVDQSYIELGVMLTEFSLPFLEMKWAEEDLLNKGKSAMDVWLERHRNLDEVIAIFFENSQKFLNSTLKWNSVLRKLKSTRNILSAEFTGVTTELWVYSQFLLDQSRNENDWRKWDKEEIKRKTKKMGDKFDVVVGGFLTDYMDHVHDELISPIFSKKSVFREDFNYTKPVEVETLTRKGIRRKKYKPLEGALLHK